MKRIEAIIRKTKFEEVKEAHLPWRAVFYRRHRARGTDHRLPRPVCGTHGEGHSAGGTHGRDWRRSHFRERHDRHVVDSHRRAWRHGAERQEVNSKL